MLRPLQKADVNRLLELWLHLACNSHPSLPPRFWNEGKRDIRRQLLVALRRGRWGEPAVTHWVYTLPGSDIAEGLVTITGDGQVEALFVSPSAQRRGVGSALINQAKFGKLQLQTAVLEENLGGRYFLQQHGFVEVSRHYRQAANQDELVMRCRIA
ncbi:GNAT family N-acetyltransferase [uncultured Microbulbifer sp.]|uniref:GNAT family N-acetyltransferase n=1 Tax=uncultured Microbulbifer sp. TaxID=348147 RepID=UPI0025F266DD|nr:GNAT family N-acetyltransferase [uncultured Microbulbifer sp.]